MYENSGITRRLDNLGRIVIPKEFRKKLGIKQGELLEMFMNDDNILIKKHAIITKKDFFLNSYINLLKEKTGEDVLISDLNEIIFSTNLELLGKNIISNSISLFNKNSNSIIKEVELKNSYVYPINPSGDLIGYVIFIKTIPSDEMLDFSIKLINNFFE